MRIEEMVGELGANADRVRRCLDLVYLQARHSARLQGTVAEILKPDSSPVTVIDLLHQSQLQQMLASNFEQDGLICEEPRSLQEEVMDEATEVSREIYGLELDSQVPEIPDEGEVTWVLDPIDGTKGFLGGRCFAIAVGFFVDREPIFGAVAVPGGDPSKERAIDGTLSFALRGRGAWTARVGAGAPDWERLRCPQWRGPELRVAVSLAHGGALVDRLEDLEGLSVEKLDSQAKYIAVAAGEIDGYLRSARDDGRTDVVWDHMPAALVAQESGCRVTHFDGGEVDFEPAEALLFRGGLICCRGSEEGELHRSLVAAASGETTS